MTPASPLQESPARAGLLPADAEAPPLADLRRLDWRFLLPDPALQEVACMGDPTSSLAIALCRACPSVIQLNERGANGSQYPLVVIDNARLGSLRTAARAVSPGGWMYAEFIRRPGHFQGWLQHPSRCCREVRRLGFHRIVASWHRPDFASGVEILPLAHPAARVFAMSRAAVSWQRWLHFAIGRFLVRTGLLPLVVPCFSVLAQKSDPERRSRVQLSR